MLAAVYIDQEKANNLVQKWKDQGYSIVFTNGCFDILHKGHLQYLAEAKGLGDKLVIGLNSDKSVSKLKGENRPINAYDARAQMLASLRMVDCVIRFEEETPLILIKQLKPDILVKGGDYKAENIVGYQETIENGGTVSVLSFLKGISSSAIINKIKNL